MRRFEPLQGVFIPMITPLFEKDGVDLAGLGKLAEHLLSAPSVSGLFTFGATGEYMRLTFEERKEAILALASVNRNGRVIVANVGGVEKEQMVELAEASSNARLDAIAAVVPEFVDGTPEGLYRYFSPLGETGLPLMVYWPSHVKNQKPTPELVASLMRIPTFVGTKDSSRDMETFAAICAEFGEQISVFQGVEMLHLPSLACGSAGVIGGGLNLYPGLLAALTNAFNRHDLPAAIRLQHEATNSWSILNAHNSFRWICKRIWAEQGMITGTYCRESDDAPLSSQEVERMRGMLRF